MDILIISLTSYLMGSIPFGLILTKIFLKKDIREIGSGNIGATNALRTGNKVIGYSTLSLDVFKAGDVVSAQDMGAAGLTCSCSEMAAKGGLGIELDLDKVPAREEGMTAYDFLLSESSLDTLSVLHLGHKPIAFKELVGSGKKEINFSEVNIMDAKDYAAEDADITFRLYKIFLKNVTTMY